MTLAELEDWNSSRSDEQDEWTLRHEFWYQCGSGNMEAVREIIHCVQNRTLPEDFQCELNSSKGTFPYTLDNMVHYQFTDGNSPLHAACANNQVEVVKLLVSEYKARMVENKSGNSPLHWAAQNGCLEVIEWLIGNVTLDVLKKNAFGKCALDYGFDSEHQGVIELLLGHKMAHLNYSALSLSGL